MTEQLLFEFFPESSQNVEPGDDAQEKQTEQAQPATEIRAVPVRSRKISNNKIKKILKRSVIKWLSETFHPNAVASDVPTRISRHQADVAAFISRTCRNKHDIGPRSLLAPEKTIIVQCYSGRDDCCPDYPASQDSLPKLCALKEKLAGIKAQIRETEPHLRSSESLFDEYAEWNYEKSSNKEYHQLQREIKKTEHTLYKGSKFEQIRNARVADFLYLAVPEGAIAPAEVADGWGLLWVREDLSITIAAEPHKQESTSANRMHLIQHIASSASKSVLFQQGLRGTPDNLAFVKRPRGRRKTIHPRLEADA